MRGRFTEGAVMKRLTVIITIILVIFTFPMYDFSTSVVKIVTKYKNMIKIKRFWRNTGLCPSGDIDSRRDFLLSDDEKLNLDLIGALPNEAITMVRIHWLLDLVKIGFTEGNYNPSFDFESLDRLIVRLHRNNLKPIFELMGNPSNYFTDFKRQSKEWTILIKSLRNHYASLYGKEYVNHWRFELMNEPDLKLYNRFNFTMENYTDYFRASESAVEKLSGPAGLFRDNRKVHSLCWGLLDYCNSNPCNLDMITFHRKGEGVGSRVVNQSLELINNLILSYPSLRGIPFGNDEADIQTGWIKPFEWRADVRYAALIVQVIIGHIKKLILDKNLPFELLSNDNAFLSFSPHYFTQRTLLARFQINNTTPKHVQFFKKPCYSVMALLSLIGNELKDIRYEPGETGFSYLLTSRVHRDAFLGVLVNDDATERNEKVDAPNLNFFVVKLNLRNSSVSGRCVGYLMDNAHDNPHKVWMDSGSPNFPDFHLRRKMRQAEGFRRFFVRDLKPYQAHITLKLNEIIVPSVFYFGVCYEGTKEPGFITDLHYRKIFTQEILLIWKDSRVKSRCILTYIVEHRKSKEESFQRIHAEETIFLSYHFDGFLSNDSFVGVNGEYRVAAVDYWNRRGPFSNVLIVH